MGMCGQIATNSEHSKLEVDRGGQEGGGEGRRRGGGEATCANQNENPSQLEWRELIPKPQGPKARVSGNTIWAPLAWPLGHVPHGTIGQPSPCRFTTSVFIPVETPSSRMAIGVRMARKNILSSRALYLFNTKRKHTIMIFLGTPNHPPWAHGTPATPGDTKPPSGHPRDPGARKLIIKLQVLRGP